MKQSNARLASKLQVAPRPRHNPRTKVLDLDDDLLLPAGHHPVVRRPAPALAPRVDSPPAAVRTARSGIADSERLSSQAEVGIGSRAPRIDTSASHQQAAEIEPDWLKGLLSGAGDRITSLERTIEEQAERLAVYQDQILDLCTTRDQQADDFQSACRAVGVLEQSLTALREAASTRDSELASTLEKLNLSDLERLTLQARVGATHKNYMQVSDRLLAAETALNDQHAVTASAWEKIDRSNAELELSRIRYAALEAELENAKQQTREIEKQQANYAVLAAELQKTKLQQSRELDKQRANYAALEAELENAKQQQTRELDKQQANYAALEAELENAKQQQTRELDRQQANYAALKAELQNTKQQQGRELEKQQANFRKEVESIKADSRQMLHQAETLILRQAETAAMDRAVLQQRCADLLRTIDVLQTARRKTSTELQVSAGDLGNLHTELSEMKTSHALIINKFEQAETKLTKMRQHIAELEKSQMTPAEPDAALAEVAAKAASHLERERQDLEFQNELLALQNRFSFADQELVERPLTLLDEVGADIIKLETTKRGKKVA